MSEVIAEPFGGVKSEAKSGSLYLVRYDEDLWVHLPMAIRESCYTKWKSSAFSLGCENVALQLIPDDLFPIHGHDKPYIVWNVVVGGKKAEELYVDTVAYVQLNEIAWPKLSDLDKMALRKRARDKGVNSGCDRYEVRLGQVNLDAGRNRRA